MSPVDSSTTPPYAATKLNFIGKAHACCVVTFPRLLAHPPPTYASYQHFASIVGVVSKESSLLDSKWSPQLPVLGSLAHLGVSRGLRSHKRGSFWVVFSPPLTPPANPVKIFWSKMACTCVPHIVLHVSCRTRTSGGYFRPSEVRFRAKIPLSSHWFYNVKTQKTQFLQNSSWDKAEIENIHCPICTQPIPSSWQNALPPALATVEQRGGPFLKLWLGNDNVWEWRP